MSETTPTSSIAAAMDSAKVVAFNGSGEQFDPLSLPIGATFTPSMISFLHKPEGEIYPVSGVTGVRVEAGLEFRCQATVRDGDTETTCPYQKDSIRSVISHKASHTPKKDPSEKRPQGRPPYKVPTKDEATEALEIVARAVRNVVDENQWRERALKAEKELAELKKQLSGLRRIFDGE